MSAHRSKPRVLAKKTAGPEKRRKKNEEQKISGTASGSVHGAFQSGHGRFRYGSFCGKD
jgi:hypothetical protein